MLKRNRTIEQVILDVNEQAHSLEDLFLLRNTHAVLPRKACGEE
jgi:hypothetical protein